MEALRCSQLIAFLFIVFLSTLSTTSGRSPKNRAVTRPSDSKCHCDAELYARRTSIVGRTRYFCGDDLNRFNQTQQCNVDRLYLCSDVSERAISISECPKDKRTINKCNDSLNSRNNCLRSMKCSCRGAKFVADQLSCGDSLRGSDCIASTIYRCRRIGAALPIENCTNGCKDRKCLAKIIELSLAADVDGKITSSNSSELSSEHEVEFVTFKPLSRKPKFEP